MNVTIIELIDRLSLPTWWPQDGQNINNKGTTMRQKTTRNKKCKSCHYFNTQSHLLWRRELFQGFANEQKNHLLMFQEDSWRNFTANKQTTFVFQICAILFLLVFIFTAQVKLLIIKRIIIRKHRGSTQSHMMLALTLALRLIDDLVMYGYLTPCSPRTGSEWSTGGRERRLASPPLGWEAARTRGGWKSMKPGLI